jgi:hypothetical protein
VPPPTSGLSSKADFVAAGRHVSKVPTPDSCAAEECRYSIISWTLESYSGNPALRKPSIISFAFIGSRLRAIHADIVKAGSISSCLGQTFAGRLGGLLYSPEKKIIRGSVLGGAWLAHSIRVPLIFKILLQHDEQ